MGKLWRQGVDRLLRLLVVEAGGAPVFIGEALGDLLSQDHNIRRSLNTQPNLPAADFQHHQPDVLADQNAFANLTGKYQHGVIPVEVSWLAFSTGALTLHYNLPYKGIRTCLLYTSPSPRDGLLS